MFLPEKKIFRLLLSFLISALVCRDLEYFQEEIATIWLQKTGYFFFHRDDTARLVIVATLSPPSIPLHCVLMPLALREPLSIVRKYKRRSLEVQISVVLSGFFDQHRGCLKSETFPRRMCCGTKECWDPKKSLKKTHLPAG